MQVKNTTAPARRALRKLDNPQHPLLSLCFPIFSTSLLQAVWALPQLACGPRFSHARFGRLFCGCTHPPNRSGQHTPRAHCTMRLPSTSPSGRTASSLDCIPMAEAMAIAQIQNHFLFSYCSLHEFWRWTLFLLLLFFRRRALGSGAGRGGLRLPRQAEAGGTSHRHPVSGPRGCRALPLHFPRCSLGALRRIGAAMASGEAASA